MNAKATVGCVLKILAAAEKELRDQNLQRGFEYVKEAREILKSLDEPGIVLTANDTATPAKFTMDL